MRDRQQGMTVIGMIIVAAFIGVMAFAILKVTPFYLEQMKIVSILGDVKRNLDGNAPNVLQIRSAIAKRINIEMVTGIDARDISIKKAGNGYRVQAKYERRAQYFSNLYLVVEIDEQVEINR